MILDSILSAILKLEFALAPLLAVPAPVPQAITPSGSGSPSGLASLPACAPLALAPALLAPTVSDVAVINIRNPQGLVGGEPARNYRVWVQNFGSSSVDVPVTVTVGMGPGAVWGSGTITVPAFSIANGLILVPTHDSTGGCGDINSFPVVACSNWADVNPSNDCFHSTVRIAVPYWDLQFEIVNAPSNVFRCTTTSWDVRVTNLGNISSMNVCALTGITLSAGPGNWNANLGLRNFTTPRIAAGSSWTFHCSNYQIPCGAFLGTQYIKTEINYAGGCFDNCTLGSNFDQQTVHVH